MSNRALVAIGCNQYDKLADLGSAEYDAEALFDTLIKPQIGDYDISVSSLLKSPTLGEVRSALASVLFSGEELETLTITFAGHGIVRAGSFYMAVKDTDADALSATALPLGELFRMIAETAPDQTYIVVDACESGGLISDLNSILKSELMGRQGTPGITLLATAASDQEALEGSEHGFGTEALLKCIVGETFLQDHNPSLDLVEIGRAISSELLIDGQQTPVVWGLNLYGPPTFCRNPHVGNEGAPLRQILSGWQNKESAAAIRSFLPRLWGIYTTVEQRFDARVYVDQVSSLFEELKDDIETIVDLNARLANAFATNARTSRDAFRPIEVEAASIVALLPFADKQAVADHITTRCLRLAAEVELATKRVSEDIREYKFALVTGGLDDLYYLPIRISKLIGWMGFAVYVRKNSGLETQTFEETFSQLLKEIIDNYSLSLTAMSDCQAPFLLTGLTAANAIELDAYCEMILGFYFHSIVECLGKVARPDLEPGKVLSYLIARGSGEIPIGLDLIAQPTEVVLVILRLSSIIGLSEEFDGSMSMLDHLPVNAYLPDDYAKFGDEQISGGLNAIFQVGHDFWRIDELDASWPQFASPQNVGSSFASILASFLFPNRTPWFISAREEN